MPTQDTEERREYYRIEDRVALEIIPGNQDQDSCAEPLPPLFCLLGELHQLDFEAQHLLRQIAESNRTLANYLKVQNKRIELLGQALAQDLLKDQGAPQPVVLSEGGISFASDKPLNNGEVLTLKLVLLPQGLGLLLAARVIYCTPMEDGQFDIGTEFEALTDAQRQLLARHILQKQALERRLALESLQGD
ncbi:MULTISPECIES: PilZ domain-containing protein [Stutzerimonas stutzeri subgroup]|uniref:PilZ domain-containing protein n=1 Tax=Stutzerimonas stutzeri TaxID=316 RepID=A0A2N8RJJ3_STUST|nr:MULTISPECIES: PilZ domain-containing protein [Stutzerimonas stutzeri subgroup]KRW68176.1 pilus assembly protein PilZ [Pseudomonas sp. TTU2014-105ASC]MBA1239183.1 PilZ domain-containing protein [Stutzerimonas kunmingensis]MCQ4252480.1 PilZ domain-containing protein [Stutzerimonas stutzeri]PNF61275.1 PilZ domain-containing protein [Stutzerimonas stutzeri]